MTTLIHPPLVAPAPGQATVTPFPSITEFNHSLKLIIKVRVLLHVKRWSGSNRSRGVPQLRLTLVGPVCNAD
jgi:hypothetical protein